MEKSRFGLIGKNISYSFSRGYFAEKFEKLNLENHSYENFDLQSIEEFNGLLDANSAIKGFNVTIPYKQEIIPYLNKIDETALQIGAVNTIKITKNNLIGYNTDVIGFQKSIETYLKPHHKRALILGTGGASKAVAYVFESLEIDFLFVSRKPGKNQISYADLNPKIMEDHTVIINCTPLGTHPEIDKRPDILYDFLSDKHLLFDLIYNPPKTSFLEAGEAKGATIVNGLKMLELQAEASWEIWNS
ncbi:shikimate dehydrogenase [Aurantibacter crassamenti]|uniref:shikimate dehydrogenase family protein n=1 Tax=Aurantibacter crassamenti TaxID=1837375 RepID=UPI00193A18DC|nr:shikimate dehydrogenase [Aurantibacter crassamenti]MBM1108189.1 shikimate dehydrogenase [Aurantibacter crassamenti]